MSVGKVDNDNEHESMLRGRDKMMELILLILKQWTNI